MDINQINQRLGRALQNFQDLEAHPENLPDRFEQVKADLEKNSSALNELHSSKDIHVGELDINQVNHVLKAVHNLVSRKDIQEKVVELQGPEIAVIFINALNELREALNKNLSEQHKRGQKVEGIDGMESS